MNLGLKVLENNIGPKEREGWLNFSKIEVKAPN
jgi:hypothetical protein